MIAKKVLLLAVLALALPMAAFASSQVDFTNHGGTLSGTNAGLTLTGSALIAVNGLNGGGLITGSNLGSVSFSTGALATGSLQAGGTFAAGGSFSVMGNGSNGVLTVGANANLVSQYIMVGGDPAEAFNNFNGFNSTDTGIRTGGTATLNVNASSAHVTAQTLYVGTMARLPARNSLVLLRNAPPWFTAWMGGPWRS